MAATQEHRLAELLAALSLACDHWALVCAALGCTQRSIRTENSMTISTVKSGKASINGIELYYEVRGKGPTVLMISGATGDAGHFTQAAELLATDHTIIT